MKVLVIGFDGASPMLIEKYIEKLPTFQRLKTEGSFGLSIPPIPAQTPVAWTTFMTGKNPGKHGIFSFAMREMGTYEREIINPSMRNAETLWKILSDNGKKVGIINVPMSDIENIEGFIIPGFLSRREGVPYPNKIKDKIRQELGVNKLVGDVETEVLNKVESEPDLFFKRISQITDETAQISRFLFREQDWDLFVTVFMGTDRIQHFFWKYVDDTHQKYERNKLTNLVRDYYLKMDKIVSDFLNSVDEDTLIIVISDHGFCPINKEIIVNNYLEEEGFLVTKSGKLDFEKSNAVSYGYGDIWLNVKGREPKGVIDPEKEYEEIRAEISKELKRIEIDSEKPIRDVKKREQLYWGSYVNQAPDLTIIFNVGWQAARHPEITKRNPLKRYVNDNPRWSGGHDGTHDPVDVPGIIGIIGQRMQKLKEVKVHLWDLAPTILNLLDVPIPDNMDGKPLPLLKK